jgi:hypothetical protein
MASRVTNPPLVSFPAFMRCVRVLVPVGLWILLTAASPSPSPTVATTPSPSPTPIPSPSPSPSPIPNNAFISLDVTAGDPTTQITVNGGAFLPNEQMTLYWDQPNKIAGGANADNSGNFITKVKPFPGDPPGVHKLCASVAPNPCANFTLAAPQTTPSPSPTPSESPSPTAAASPEQTPSPTPVATTLSGLDVITKPPFVFLPIIGIVAILISLGYWILSIVRRPAPKAIPSAAVMHRATRPDYSAGFGTPPPAPAPAAPEPSAWAEPPPAPPAPPPPPPSAWETGGEAAAWGPGTPDAGYPELAPPEEPTELPEHGEAPEPGT